MEVWYSSGLKEDFSYSDKEPMRMAWNGGSHRVAFEELQKKLVHNCYMPKLIGQAMDRCILDTAMV